MEEAELVQGLRERRDDAVRLFLERYRPIFRHCIGRFESDPELREDLLQELVWHALERLDRGGFDPSRGSFGTWLYRLSWCRCVDLKRAQNARRRTRPVLGIDLADQPGTAPGPAADSAQREVAALVRQAMAELEPGQQRLVELRFVRGLLISEVAETLGITMEQAKYRLRQASLALRRSLIRLAPREEAWE